MYCFWHGKPEPTHLPVNRRQSHFKAIYLGLRRRHFFTLFFDNNLVSSACSLSVRYHVFVLFMQQNLHGVTVTLGQRNLEDRKLSVMLTGYRTGEPRCATFFPSCPRRQLQHIETFKRRLKLVLPRCNLGFILGSKDCPCLDKKDVKEDEKFHEMPIWVEMLNSPTSDN